MALTIDPGGLFGPVATSQTIATWSDSNACPYCGATLYRSGGMGQRGDRYEWRDEEWCPACGWRREEIRSLPVSRVYGRKEAEANAVP